MNAFLQQNNIIDVIRQHALDKPLQDAVTLVADPNKPEAAVSLSYQQLDTEARRIASWLQQRGKLGDRVLLLYAPGVNFAAAFIGCIYAGMIAVPAPLPGQHPHQQRRIYRIATDAGISALLTDSYNLDSVTVWAAGQELDHITRLATDSVDFADPDAWQMPQVEGDSLALLQYTSGSTGNPKGVMVSHRNLLHNADSLCRAYGLSSAVRFGGWIPLFHDMGLMGLLLPALFLGSTCILMTPTTFLKRPYLWLRMIAQFQIGFTAAPNFAYELCLRRITDDQLVGVDLSHWRFAANGSELVQAETIHAFSQRFADIGFGAHVICPCYGMAETTLFVSGSGSRAAKICEVDIDLLGRHQFAPIAHGDGRAVVSCGVVHDFDVLIVDPDSCAELAAGAIGEIWLRGPSVARGYWQNAEASTIAFNASTTLGNGGYFRTGDLGVLHHGELYITGRLKEMLIVHGRNLYPQDIEQEVRAHHAELSSGVGAVFTVTTPQEEVVVTHEIRSQCSEEELHKLVIGIKTTVMRELEVRVAAVVLLRPGGVLRTTSGKIQRGAMQAAFMQQSLMPVYEEVDPHLQALRRAVISAPLPDGQGAMDINETDVSALAVLERMLVDAEQEGKPFSAAVCAEHDRLEQFPAAACDVLGEFGIYRYYVPLRHGGKMTSFTELLQLWRAVARRDLTVAIGHGKTFLGAACVWVADNTEQAREVGHDVSTGVVMSWGLTERHHGSDLLAGELTAMANADGWLVNGEKWLINNATRGQVLCALARTEPAGGPRGFSLLLMDKRTLAEDSYCCLPKELTHGIRGADISGIEYRNAQVPHSALVGKVGQGIEIVLKALQLSRTTCVALSLGAADHALQLALTFTAQRQLYGRQLLDLPVIRRTVGEAAATLLAAEAVSVVSSRCIAALPGEMSVVAALAKAFVPSAVDELIATLGEVLGARAFLTGVFAHGMFQKIERDHRLVAIFDGSTVVNRNSLINQFRTLARAYDKQSWDSEGLALAVDLNAPLPEFAPQKLRVMSSSGCSVLQSLPHAVIQLAQVDPGRRPSATVLRLTEALRDAAADVMEECAAYQPSAREVPSSAFDLARRYELCFAGAACIQLWLANHCTVCRGEVWPSLWRNDLWLHAALVRILTQLTPAASHLAADVEIYDRLTDCITANAGMRVSLLPANSNGGWL